MTERHEITGLVLAGGRCSRMGGVDKGLQNFRGEPLARHALQRLAPQVGALLLNANRNREIYETMGAPVLADAVPDYAGPLAGFIAGLQHATTPWLVTVPCDTPDFPLDLVARLSAAADAQRADIAMPLTIEDGAPQVQPVFCLMRVSLLPSLLAFTQSGQRKIDRWTSQHVCVEVPFDDAAAFANANTQAELERLQAGKRSGD